MATNYNPKIPTPESLFNLIDANNSKHTSGSGNISDAINNIVWARGGTVTDTTEDGIVCFNMDGVNVGTIDRVGSGTDLYRVGWPGQGPGKMAVMGSYNKLLSSNEIQELHNTLYARII